MKLQQFLKRMIDVMTAFILLFILSPLLVLVLVALFIFEGAPLFYRSFRFVKPNKSIPILKFRSMVKNANSPNYKLRERFMRDGYLDIPLSCEVYTPIGRWLERTQIVEIPQLWAVIFNQMSFVGNRPLPLENVEELKKFNNWEKRFDSPAGISGIAQVVGKFSLQPTERLNLEKNYSEVYQNGHIMKCDLMIFFYTLRLIILGKGISIDRGQQLLKSCLPVHGK